MREEVLKAVVTRLLATLVPFLNVVVGIQALGRSVVSHINRSLRCNQFLERLDRNLDMTEKDVLYSTCSAMATLASTLGGGEGMLRKHWSVSVPCLPDSEPECKEKDGDQYPTDISCCGSTFDMAYKNMAEVIKEGATKAQRYFEEGGNAPSSWPPSSWNRAFSPWT